MAGINLTPNLPVIISHAVVFGAAIAVVNRLILKPYSQLREKRDSLTTGSQEDAKIMFEQIDRKSAEIRIKRQQVAEHISVLRATSRKSATEEANFLIDSAKLKAAQEVAEAKKLIAQNISDEISKISKVADKISFEIFEAALK